MSEWLSRLSNAVPERFLAVLVIGTVYAGILTVDQSHWWQLKPDYAFGWMVPFLVVHLVYSRWPAIRGLFTASGPRPLPVWAQRAGAVAAAGLLVGGVSFFLMGMLYRAGTGVSQPGSMAIAIGFAGLFLGMIYFNVPPGAVPGTANDQRPGWRSDSRLRACALFLFPALIWIISAPLVSAVENALSLHLLRWVVAVVYFVFNSLGFTLVQQGNILILPKGQVGVAEACSGIRSLTACLFAGSFLAAMMLDHFWKKVLLVLAALVLAFLTNMLRSIFLTGWAYAYGSEAIEGALHDGTGFAVLGLTVVGLFSLLRFFSGENWRRWLGLPRPLPADT